MFGRKKADTNPRSVVDEALEAFSTTKARLVEAIVDLEGEETAIRGVIQDLEEDLKETNRERVRAQKVAGNIGRLLGEEE